jgi:hypothetical protein
MRTWLASVVLLAAGAVQAADYHVLRDTDGDGNANACPNTAHRAHYASDSVACGANSALSECGGSGGCDAASHGTGGFPFKLEAGSPLIDTGSNNPLGQGANKCTISAGKGFVTFPSGPIACYLDRDGDDRRNMGTSWDIGADEYDNSIPAVCGDGLKGGIEECDGSDFGSSTCIDFGFTGGTLACTAGCTADTSACVSIPPGDVPNARRTDKR